MIHADLRYKTLGYLLTILTSGRRVTTLALNSPIFEDSVRLSDVVPEVRAHEGETEDGNVNAARLQ